MQGLYSQEKKAQSSIPPPPITSNTIPGVSRDVSSEVNNISYQGADSTA